MIAPNFPNTDILESITTIEEGYTCDLKYDSGDFRIWLHRTSIEDGEPYRNTATIEGRTRDGQWVDVVQYDADHADERSLYIWTDYEHLIDAYEMRWT
jgi:hypothetical protein